MIKVKISVEQAHALLIAATQGPNTLTDDQARLNEEACEVIWEQLVKAIPEPDDRIYAA